MWNALCALLYPARCAACDGECEEGAAFCRTCDVMLEPIRAACARCGLPTAHGHCGACLQRPPAFARATAPYEFGGALASALRRLKWAGRPDLGRRLARLLPAEPFARADLVVPVPLHPRRLREREYNQAALLALPRAGNKLELALLERRRDTRPQASLKPAERRENVRGAFIAHAAAGSILLVDDVMTTGATVEACAEALLEAGAAEVAVLTVARAVP